MRLSYILFIYLTFVVTAKKHKHTKHKYDSRDESDVISSPSSDEQTEEYAPFTDRPMDLRGNLRKYFALEAAFANNVRNMICSPISALMPLGKLALGSEKKSERELLAALGLKSKKQIKNAFTTLITNMEYLTGVTLDMASRIYINSQNKMRKRFYMQTKLIFKSSAEKISTSRPREAAASINDWVSEKTRNKIERLINPDDINSDTSMILVNAVYFSGNWMNQFTETYSDEFFTPTGIRKLPMMRRQGLYNYWKCDVLNAQVIEIPYEGRQATMIIVLPFSKNGLPVLLRALKLAPELLNDALEKMKRANVILSMPKFKIETEINLGALYEKIGLASIFDQYNSDLTRIIKNEKVYVSKAIHKAVIEVTEKGTEAAGASGVIVSVGSAPGSPDDIEFTANHSFYFVIAANRPADQLYAGVFSG